MTAPQIALPLPAASMVFIRNSSEGIEVYMVVRSRLMDFAAGAMVFPGGKVTAADAALAGYAETSLIEGGGHLMPIHRRYAIAALRESFEEAGLLLAATSDGQPVPESRVRALDPLRAAIDKGQHSFAAMLEVEQLRLQLDGVERFGHIITPAIFPKRFDTHFYIAAAPADHEPKVDMSEIVEGFWISAAKAIAENGGAYVLMKPTRMVLQRLAASNTVADALRDAATFEPPVIEPMLAERNGEAGLATPELPGFVASWEPMDAAWAATVGKK